MVVALRDGILYDEYVVGKKPCYLTTEELLAVHEAQPSVYIFDRDDDHMHMTAVIEKGAADG